MDIFNLRKVDPKRIALIENNINITYQELIERAVLFAEQIETRSVVFIVTRNVVEAIYIYIGTLLAGSVPLLLHETISSTRLVELSMLYRPRYIFTLIHRRDCFEDYIWRERYEYYDMWKVVSSDIEKYKINAQLALLLSTSGSTGSNKCVRISYMNLLVNTKAIIKDLRITERDVVITTLPMDYTYGLSIINTHLMAGATIVLCRESIISEQFWKTLRENRCTTFGGVPFIYETIIKLKLFNKLEGIRYLTQAGGKLQKKHVEIMVKECMKRKIEFIVMYGQTEATARMAYLPWKYALLKAESVGIPISGGKFSIVDLNGNTVEQGAEGELVYEGENVSLGYASNYRDLCLGDVRNGVLYTGDIARCDVDGFYYIMGRKTRILKLYGKRVSLDEIEIMLQNNGIECACVGKDNHLVVVIVYPNQNDIVKKLLVAYGIDLICLKIYCMERLPINTSSKIDYMRLTDLFVNEL